MQLAIVFALVLIRYAFTISAAPPPLATKGNSLLLPFTANNITIVFQNNTIGANPSLPCSTAIRHVYREIEGTGLSLDIFICRSFIIDYPAWYNNTFVSVRQLLGIPILTGHGDNLIHPDPFVSQRRPGENCSIKTISASNPGLSYDDGYQALLAMYGVPRGTYENDASAFALLYKSREMREMEHIGTVMIRPFED